MQPPLRISPNTQHYLLFKLPLFDNRLWKFSGTKPLISLIRIIKIDPFFIYSYYSMPKMFILRICQQLFANAHVVEPGHKELLDSIHSQGRANRDVNWWWFVKDLYSADNVWVLVLGWCSAISSKASSSTPEGPLLQGWCHLP